LDYMPDTHQILREWHRYTELGDGRQTSATTFLLNVSQTIVVSMHTGYLDSAASSGQRHEQCTQGYDRGGEQL